MNTKMFFVAVLSAMAVGYAVADDTYTYQALYWQVDNETAGYYSDAAYAVLYATVQNDTIQLDGRALSDAYSGTHTDFVGGEASPSWSSFDFSSASFYVELWNDSACVAESEDFPMYSELTAYMDRNSTGMPSPTTPSSYYLFTFAIPEPTSGLLMLIGMAGLALRRKRLA